MPRRRSSLSITLVLIGAATLSACGDEEPTQRDVYTKLEDCQKDWGRPENCEPVKDGRYSHSYFYGPYYAGSRYSSGRLRASPNAVAATPVAHGGFGSTASLHSSGS